MEIQQASKMMRIAGRGIDGTAKPIRTDNSGNMGTIYTGGLSATRTTHRINGLSGGTEEEFLVVQQEAIIHNLQFFFDREDLGVRAYLDVWNGQNLADGTHFRPYTFLTSPSSATGVITPGNMLYNNLFVENNNVIYLVQPLHLKGFRIRLRNNLSDQVNLGCNILWSEV